MTTILHVLLFYLHQTQASGSLGSAILTELLASKTFNVFVLAREESKTSFPCVESPFWIDEVTYHIWQHRSPRPQIGLHCKRAHRAPHLSSHSHRRGRLQSQWPRGSFFGPTRSDRRLESSRRQTVFPIRIWGWHYEWRSAQDSAITERKEGNSVIPEEQGRR